MRRFAKVRAESGQQRRLTREERVLEFAELRAAPIQWPGGAGVKESALPMHELGEFHISFGEVWFMV
jgi:hypothetical protein